MSKHEKLKALLEELKLHSEKSNDPELKELAQKLDSYFNPAGDEEGGNNPEPPDVP